MGKEVLKGVVGMLPLLARLVTPDVIRKATGAFIEVIEDRCRDSENKIDDAVVLPICAAIRTGLGLPDEDNDNR